MFPPVPKKNHPPVASPHIPISRRATTPITAYSTGVWPFLATAADGCGCVGSASVLVSGTVADIGSGAVGGAASGLAVDTPAGMGGIGRSTKSTATRSTTGIWGVEDIVEVI